MTEAKIPEIRGLKEEPSQTKKCEAEHCLEDGICPAPRNRDDLRSYVCSVFSMCANIIKVGITLMV